jgi:LPXTG-motif cell wall-anchored protein
MMEFMSSWTFIIIMIVLFLALVGLLLFLRSKRQDD